MPDKYAVHLIFSMKHSKLTRSSLSLNQMALSKKRFNEALSLFVNFIIDYLFRSNVSFTWRFFSNLWKSFYEYFIISCVSVEIKYLKLIYQSQLFCYTFTFIFHPNVNLMIQLLLSYQDILSSLSVKPEKVITHA